MPRLGFIFDWDGVVVNSSKLHEKSWELLADEIGMSLPHGHFKKALEKETLLSFRRFSDGVGKKVKLKNGVYERRKSTGNLEETGALR